MFMTKMTPPDDEPLYRKWTDQSTIEGRRQDTRSLGRIRNGGLLGHSQIRSNFSESRSEDLLVWKAPVAEGSIVRQKLSQK
jgi:hypothetical protein